MKAKGECSAAIRERVIKAKEIQTKRYENIEGMYCDDMDELNTNDKPMA